MKTTIIWIIGFASALLLSYSANASTIRVDAEVLQVEPVLKYTTINGVENQVREVCQDRRARDNYGIFERGTESIFGSNGGFLGSVVGVAVADKLDANNNARIIAGLIGNRIGNDLSNKGKYKYNCEFKEIPVKTSHVAQILDYYLVTVQYGGSLHQLKRNFQPAVGDLIKVSFRIN